MHGSTKGKSMRAAALLAVGAVAAGFLAGGCGKKEDAPRPAASQPPAAEKAGPGPAPQANPTGEPEARKDEPTEAAAVEPTKVVVTWNEKIHYAPDPVLIGSPLKPCLMGHVQFFGGSRPVKGDGTLTVELFQPGDKPEAGDILREQFVITADVLAAMADKEGPGYTLILPWSTYTPDFKRVKLNVSYESAKGTKLQADGEPIALKDSPQTDTASTPTPKPEGTE